MVILLPVNHSCTYAFSCDKRPDTITDSVLSIEYRNNSTHVLICELGDVVFGTAERIAECIPEE